MNAFAVDVWRKLGSAHGNALVSPGSLWLALAMLTTGARGRTRAQLARALHLPAEEGTLDASRIRLLEAWNTESEESGLTQRVVNRLFGDRGVSFEEPWLASMERTWRMKIDRLGFRQEPEAARTHINSWVSQQTAGRIHELLPDRSITEETRLVLINAVYFLARWVAPFEAELTSNLPFFEEGGRTSSVPTMAAVQSLRYAEDDAVQAIELPYRDSPVSMVILLPRSRYGLGGLEQTLSPAAVEGWVAAMDWNEVEVSLPKFRLEPAESVRLRPALESLGVHTAFDRAQADFSAIANPPSPEDRLVVDEVFHQVFLEVDEAGTEAAAATAVVMLAAGCAPSGEERPKPRVFRADHPFIFLLRDMETGVWLFIGRVCSP